MSQSQMQLLTVCEQVLSIKIQRFETYEQGIIYTTQKLGTVNVFIMAYGFNQIPLCYVHLRAHSLSGACSITFTRSSLFISSIITVSTVRYCEITFFVDLRGIICLNINVCCASNLSCHQKTTPQFHGQFSINMYCIFVFATYTCSFVQLRIYLDFQNISKCTSALGFQGQPLNQSRNKPRLLIDTLPDMALLIHCFR